MDKEQYQDYEKAVKAFFDREGINNLSIATSEETPVCCACNEEHSFEPYFSWESCECCGDTAGGNRYHANGYNPKDQEAYCYEVCSDCIYYAAYGQLDDMTMLEIERE